MAQGRVAHLIEWKGWCKPIDTPAALESDFNSYSDLTEGEQEARFAAGKIWFSISASCLIYIYVYYKKKTPCSATLKVQAERQFLNVHRSVGKRYTDSHILDKSSWKCAK